MKILVSEMFILRFRLHQLKRCLFEHPFGSYFLRESLNNDHDAVAEHGRAEAVKTPRLTCLRGLVSVCTMSGGTAPMS